MTFNLSEAAAALSWIDSVTEKKAIDVGASVLRANGDVQRVTLASSVVSELLISPPRRATKDPFTLSFQALAPYLEGSAMKVAEPKRAMEADFVAALTALPQVQIVGVQPFAIRPLIIVSPPQGEFILPQLRYADISIGCLKFEFGAASYKGAQDLALKTMADGTVGEDEYSEATVSATDDQGKIKATLRFASAPVAAKLNADQTTATVDLVVRRMFIEIGTAKTTVGPFAVDPKRC